MPSPLHPPKQSPRSSLAIGFAVELIFFFCLKKVKESKTSIPARSYYLKRVNEVFQNLPAALVDTPRVAAWPTLHGEEHQPAT